MITRRAFAFSVAAFTEAGLAQRALVPNDWPADTVWLNANENPDGPPGPALDAIAAVAPEVWRYHFPELGAFAASIARSESLGPEQVTVGAGSTEILNVAVAAFTSPTRPVIVSEPTFEAPAEMARALGHPVVSIPLTESYTADVKRMAEAAKAGGLIYLCNPNNPTSSLTPAEDIAWLVENAPRDTVVLIDEAYLHFVDGYEQRSGMRWVLAGKDVVVTRTFSKIYGMAGLRCGFGAAPAVLTRRMRPFRNNMISAVALRAATAALAAGPKLIADRRTRLARVRTGLCRWLDTHKFRYIGPQANFIMIETGRNAREIGAALAARKIAVGRPFPPLDSMLRVTIGTEVDMARFESAFLAVTGA